MNNSEPCPTCGGETRAGACPRCFFSTALLEDDTSVAAETPEPIESYEFIAEIARGGMGVVWRARQKKLGREVAVKLLRDDALPGEAAARRFRIEGEAIAQLRHPHIVAVYEVGETGGRSFLSMELLGGGTLAGRLKNGPLPARQAVELLVKIARAIHFAHERGVLHRDLKPGNILFDDTGEPRVSDFGLARMAGSDTGLTISGVALGTPAYMPPEQAAGRSHDVTTASDVYGLGAILYEMLTGQPPFRGDSQLEVLRRVTDEEPVRPSSIVGRVDRDLETICLKCLEKSSSARYPSAMALAEDLGRWLLGEPIRARAVTAPERLWKWVRRHPAWAALWLTVALALGTVATISNLARLSAEASLDRLRGTAPAFYAQALGLRDDLMLAEAEEKTVFASELQPRHADYHLLRGQLVQSQLRLPEAAEHFRRVLALRPGDRPAASNLELCERLWPLTPDRQSTLLAALIAQQRAAESVVLARAIGQASAADRLLIESRLVNLRDQRMWGDGERLQRLTDGTWRLNLNKLDVTELSFLRGLPLSSLSLEKCDVSDLRPLADLPIRSLILAETKVTDLRPLAKLPLRELSLWKTGVRDLSPLAGLKLIELSIAYCPVTDLAPLRGMPLQKLDVDGLKVPDFSVLLEMPLTWLQARDGSLADLRPLSGKKIVLLRLGHSTVSDLTPLSGMPLVELDLGGCSRVRDLSPLTGMKSLRRLLLPPECGDLPVLRSLMALERLGDLPYERYGWKFGAVPAAADFLAENAAAITARGVLVGKLRGLHAELRRLNVSEKDFDDRVRFDAQRGSYRIVLDRLPVSDLSFLAGMPVRDLSLVGTEVKDLSAVAGLPIESLSVSETKVKDLAPLVHCPKLRVLYAYATAVSDLRPIAGSSIESLYISHTAVTDLSPLTNLPLLRLSANRCPIADVAPLLALPKLAFLSIDSTVPGLERLRTHPGLQYLDTYWNLTRAHPARTVAEFWADFDAELLKTK